MICNIKGVYSARDLVFRFPANPGDLGWIVEQLFDQYSWNRPITTRLEIQETINTIERDGVAILHNVFSPDLILQARRDIDRIVEKIPGLKGMVKITPDSYKGTRNYQTHEYQQEQKHYHSFDPLMFSPTYTKFLLLPDLIEILAGYLGNSWIYQSMHARRSEPTTEPIHESFADWHHDGRGRKLNAILLLHDVNEDGPATVVLKGSHRLLYSRERRKKNFFSDKEIEIIQRKYDLVPFVCSAPAGSLIFFDAHGLHFGKRTNHSRDVFQVNCMTKRKHIFPHEIDKKIFSALDEKEQQLLLQRANLSVI